MYLQLPVAFIIFGTNSSRPFNPINTEDIVRRLPNDYFCTEFWTKHSSWGWPSLPRHMKTAHQLGLQRIFAEGFTHWPMDAWQEDPASQKVLADKAFCLGVNSLMLHAGAQNPWPKVVPGMTFGKWGSWWTPGQTWCRSGAAKLFFSYLSRCQALLQRGVWIDDYTSSKPSLKSSQEEIQWTHRRDGDTDIYFLSNPLDSAFTAHIVIADSIGRWPEIWLPETGEKNMGRMFAIGEESSLSSIHFDENESMFIVLREPHNLEIEGYLAGNSESASSAPAIQDSNAIGYSWREQPVTGPWTLRFPEGWDAPDKVVLDRLTP